MCTGFMAFMVLGIGIVGAISSDAVGTPVVLIEETTDYAVVSIHDETFQPLPILVFNDLMMPTMVRSGLGPFEDIGSQIPVGSIIYHSTNGITRVFDSQGKQILIANDNEGELIAAPGGYKPATKIHQIPNGSLIKSKGEVTEIVSDEKKVLTVINQRDELVLPDYDGWIESSRDLSIDELAQFIAYWTVPSSPPSPQQNTVDFLFNAIQSASIGGIAQPVLEWNQAGSGRWTGAAWFVPYQQEGYYSEPIDVDVGDTIKGTLGWNPGLSQWNIIFKNEDSGISTMNWSGCVGYQNNAVFCTLEGYYVDGDSEVPGDTTFYDMRLKDLNLQNVEFNWEEDIDEVAEGYLSGLDVQIYSDSMVTLHTAN